MQSGRDTDMRVEMALLALLAVLWGSAYLFVKVAVAEIPPLTLIALRTTVAGAFLYAVVRWRGERLPRDPAVWLSLFFQAVIICLLAWTILAWGQQSIDSALASVLNSTTPVFAILITVLITRHEPIGRAKIAGALLGIAGVVLIVGVDAVHGLGQQVAGQLAALFGALCYGVAAIYGRNFNNLPAAVASTGTMIGGAAMLVPASLIFEHPWTLRPSAAALAAALALALASTGLAFLIYYRLIRTLGSTGVTSQAFLRPAIGILFGVLFLGEHIAPPVAAGLALTVIGVAAINVTLPAGRGKPRGA